MGLFDSISKGLSELDITRKNSAASKVSKAVATGGVSLVAGKKTVVGKALTGLDNAARDTSKVGVIGFNAVGAAVGAKGASKRLASDVKAVKKQLPVVMNAVGGFAKGGIAGAIVGGGTAIATGYVVPEVVGSRTTAPSVSPPTGPASPGPGATGGVAFGSDAWWAAGGTSSAVPQTAGATSDPLVALGLWIRRTFHIGGAS